jgi:uncharacterized protein YcbK (DUF882 family)
MKLTKNFSISEFYCNDGAEIPEDYYGNVQELADNLQVLRDFLGVPISINSGYRHPEYNKSVGGSKKSQHLTASAADIRTVAYSPKEIAMIIEGLIRIGAMKQGGLGLYDTFVHYDIRGSRSRWNG